MEKNKVVNLAQSFTMSCKEVIKSNQLAHGLTSPAITLIAITILRIMVEGGGIDKQMGWGVCG